MMNQKKINVNHASLILKATPRNVKKQESIPYKGSL